jgi:hypothetical protein
MKSDQITGGGRTAGPTFADDALFKLKCSDGAQSGKTSNLVGVQPGEQRHVVDGRWKRSELLRTDAYSSSGS